MAHLNSFFKYLFFKFISKCQKEILSCAPPATYVCDFLKMVACRVTHCGDYSTKKKTIEVKD